jgi:hypothetical protein
MENNSIRFYLKELRKKIKFIDRYGELIIAPPPPVLRRTSRAIDCQLQDPSYSMNCLCQMDYDYKNNVYNIKVFDFVSMIEDEDRRNKKEWIDVNWKIDKFQKNLYYYVTSNFNAPRKCIEPIDNYYVLCRSQFCPILIFFILKLKVKCLRIKKKRYLKMIFGDIADNIVKLVPFTRLYKKKIKNKIV